MDNTAAERMKRYRNRPFKGYLPAVAIFGGVGILLGVVALSAVGVEGRVAAGFCSFLNGAAAVYLMCHYFVTGGDET